MEKKSGSVLNPKVIEPCFEAVPGAAVGRDSLLIEVSIISRFWEDPQSRSSSTIVESSSTAMTSATPAGLTASSRLSRIRILSMPTCTVKPLRFRLQACRRRIG